MKRNITLFALCAAAACSDATAPSPQIELYALADTVRVSLVPYMQPYNRLTMQLNTSVPAKIRNTSAYLITPRCERQVYRQLPDSLSPTWSPGCLAVANDGNPGNGIAPGEERAFSFDIFATVSGPQGMTDWNSPTVGGTYRLSIIFEARAVATPAKVVARGQAYSNTFEIVQNP
jgi:hypothetical protein